MFVALTSQVAESGLVDSLADTVFDAQWNADHRFWIWGTIAVVLFLSGAGLPLPEDIPLTAAGFTTYQQCARDIGLRCWLPVFAGLATVILAGDLVAYGMGRRWGLGLRERIAPLRRVVTDERVAKINGWFARYGSFAVFMGRQVAGLRFATFFLSGAVRMPLRKFVFFDFLGCVVSVPVWLTLGALASRYGAKWLGHATRHVSGGFLVTVLVAILMVVVVVKLRAWRARR